ncbi:MAG: hypothetical protein NT061_09615 [Spirochaetes bacterium]|nr:hypothetical protein [Spirochaetota bacterium]
MGTEKNRRFSRTKHVDESGAWYNLDNAGIIMPAVVDSVNTELFRLEAVLDAEPDAEILRKALAQTTARFHYFNVTLKRGLFWYYLDQCGTSPPLYSDDSDPCQGWDINKRGTRLFRVLLSGRRVACEFSHALTDGSGGFSFMKTFLTRYFSLIGIAPGTELGTGEFADILDIEDQAHLEEYEDGYQKYFPGKLPLPEPNPSAWHQLGDRLPKGEYRIITGSLDLPALLAEAKKRNVTLTEFLAAVYLDALQELWFSLPKRPREHFISLEIPVNLRQFFPSKTNRNFSLFILLRENLQLGRRSFDELVKRAHYQMRLEHDIKSISRQIARNAGGTRNFAVRIIPLFIKDIFARILFAKLGETMLSGFITNMGQIRLPPGVELHIESFAFVPPPSTTTLTNIAVNSWKGRLIVTFGSLAVSRELERLFFTRLRSLGFAASVRCRGEEE